MRDEGAALPTPDIYWADISADARELVAAGGRWEGEPAGQVEGMLTVDPAKRMTIQQVLEHPLLDNPRSAGGHLSGLSSVPIELMVQA